MPQVILVGYTRSGTASIARTLFHMGLKDSVHESKPRPGDIPIYDIFNPPPAVPMFLEWKNFWLNFDSNWEYSKWMYVIQQKYPHINFWIMLRDPVFACNSMVLHALKVHARHYSIDLCARKYDEVYSFMIEQIIHMNPKPKRLSFEKYVKGGYTEKFIEYFNLPEEKARKEAKRMLKIKMNSHGDYIIQDTPRQQNVGSILEKCQMMRRIIESLCEEL